MKGDTPVILYNMCLDLDKLYSDPIDGLDEYIRECRCHERLKTEPEGSTRLTYTGCRGELEHLKIETRLINERFASVMGV